MFVLPLPALFLLVVGGAALLSVGGLIVVRRYIGRPARNMNEVPGFLYAVVGVIYGVMLAFIVLVVWERFAATDQAVTTEAADLVAVFRDTQAFPEPLRQEAQDALRAYVHEVVTSEWRSWIADGHVVPHTRPDPLNPVWEVYRQVQPGGDLDAAEVEHATERLHELERQRHLRHLSAEGTLPAVYWPVIIGGFVLTVGFSYFFRLENLVLQAAMTGLLAAVLAGVLLLIVSLNEPFTGPVAVEPAPFEHALDHFNAIDFGTPVASTHANRVSGHRTTSLALNAGAPTSGDSAPALMDPAELQPWLGLRGDEQTGLASHIQ